MIKKIKNSLKSDFNKNILTLFTGSVLSQSIAFLILPIVTRIYTEKEMGVFVLFSSFVLVLSIISTLKYSMSIILASNNKEAVNMGGVSFVVAIMVSVFLLLFFIFFGSWFREVFNINKLDKWIYFVPIAILLNGIYDIFNSFFGRNKRYSIATVSKLNKSGSTAFFQLSSAKLGGLGLVIGSILGQVISVLYFVVKFIREYKKVLKYFSIQKMKEGAKFHKNILVFNSLLGISNAISNQIPVFLLSSFFGLGSVAVYGVASKVVTVPFSMISQSFNEVFYRECSEKYHRKEVLYSYIVSIYKKLFLIGVLPILILVITAPLVFKIFFGDVYFQSGQYIQILAPWLLIAFISTPTHIIATVIKKQHLLFYIDFLFLVIRSVCMFSGCYFFQSILSAIILYSISSFLYEAVIIGVFLQIIKKQNHKY